MWRAACDLWMSALASVTHEHRTTTAAWPCSFPGSFEGTHSLLCTAYLDFGQQKRSKA